jgi:alkylation response protein AidB-like acyl-CoA dehydrogenase
MLGAFCPDRAARRARTPLRCAPRPPERRRRITCINGVKQFITSGQERPCSAIVIAVTDKGAGKKGMSAFLVPTSNPGLRAWRGLEDKLGQHSSDTAQINFDHCRIPAREPDRCRGRGLQASRSVRFGGRAHRHRRAKRGHGAQRVRRSALAYSKERESFGTPDLQPPGRGFPPGRVRHADGGRAPAHLARRCACATPAAPA